MCCIKTQKNLSDLLIEISNFSNQYENQENASDCKYFD